MNGVALILRAASDLAETLDAIVVATAQALPQGKLVSLVLTEHGGELRTVAQSDASVLPLDAMQMETLEGPAMDAFRSGDVVWSDDLAADTRWPLYASAAAGLGYASQMSLPLPGRGGSLGVINLYAGPAATFDADAREIGELLAGRVAAELIAADSLEGLQTALASRASIGEALGIVMERYRLDQDAAFQFLVRLSQTGNVKLKLVAEKLVESANDQAT